MVEVEITTEVFYQSPFYFLIYVPALFPKSYKKRMKLLLLNKMKKSVSLTMFKNGEIVKLY